MYDIAIYLSSGCIAGLTLHTRRITSNYTMSHSDVYISCHNNSNIAVYLPPFPQMGEIKFVRMNTSNWVTVYSGVNKIWKSAGEITTSTYAGEGDGDMGIFV